MSVLDHMCSVCDNYMVLRPSAPAEGEAEAKEQYYRECRSCGKIEREKPGLVMETIVQESAAESYRVAINEFTTLDPRLPHLTTLKCPKEGCDSKDVIYKRYDLQNLKFLYICTKCKTHWRSR